MYTRRNARRNARTCTHSLGLPQHCLKQQADQVEFTVLDDPASDWTKGSPCCLCSRAQHRSRQLDLANMVVIALSLVEITGPYWLMLHQSCTAAIHSHADQEVGEALWWLWHARNQKEKCRSPWNCDMLMLNPMSFLYLATFLILTSKTSVSVVSNWKQIPRMFSAETVTWDCRDWFRGANIKASPNCPVGVLHWHTLKSRSFCESRFIRGWDCHVSCKALDCISQGRSIPNLVGKQTELMTKSGKDCTEIFLCPSHICPPRKSLFSCWRWFQPFLFAHALDHLAVAGTFWRPTYSFASLQGHGSINMEGHSQLVAFSIPSLLLRDLFSSALPWSLYHPLSTLLLDHLTTCVRLQQFLHVNGQFCRSE